MNASKCKLHPEAPKSLSTVVWLIDQARTSTDSSVKLTVKISNRKETVLKIHGIMESYYSVATEEIVITCPGYRVGAQNMGEHIWTHRKGCLKGLLGKAQKQNVLSLRHRQYRFLFCFSCGSAYLELESACFICLFVFVLFLFNGVSGF